jgi:hypothetical protein
VKRAAESVCAGKQGTRLVSLTTRLPSSCRSRMCDRHSEMQTCLACLDATLMH